MAPRVAREHSADRALVARAQVVRALDRDDRVEPDRLAAALVQEIVLAEQLDRTITGPMDPDLRPRQQAVAQLETDLRRGVEAEEVGGQVAEIALVQRPREAMRH